MRLLRVVACLLTLIGITPAYADVTAAQVQDGFVTTSGCPSGQTLCWLPWSVANPLPVTGSFSATLSGFTPASVYATPLSVSGTSSRVALPAGTTVAVYNVGANGAYVTLGGAGATATASDDYIAAGACAAYTVGSNADLAAITASSTTTLNLSGGAGLFTASCAGGGGGGGQVTNAGTFAVQLTGATNNINNIAGTVSLPTGASTSANQSTEITSLATIATNSGLASTLATATTGGDTSFSVIAANSNNATSVSSGAHTIYEVQVTNYGTNLGDLRIYDVSGAPTCSSATGKIRNWPVQSNAISPGFTYSFPLGIAIATGLSFCFTGAVADNDNTSFAGTNAAINIGYK